MFSRYRKDEKAPPTHTHLAAAAGHPQAKAPPAAAAVSAAAQAQRKPSVGKTKAPANAASPDREQRRMAKISDLKLELHKQLLDQLNLAAIESASEQELRAEISQIASEVLGEQGVVVNKDDRRILNNELYDEVRGLGPLEP